MNIIIAHVYNNISHLFSVDKLLVKTKPECCNDFLLYSF